MRTGWAEKAQEKERQLREQNENRKAVEAILQAWQLHLINRKWLQKQKHRCSTVFFARVLSAGGGMAVRFRYQKRNQNRLLIGQIAITLQIFNVFSTYFQRGQD